MKKTKSWQQIDTTTIECVAAAAAKDCYSKQKRCFKWLSIQKFVQINCNCCWGYWEEEEEGDGECRCLY